MYRSCEEFQSSALDARLNQNPSSILDRRSARPNPINLCFEGFLKRIQGLPVKFCRYVLGNGRLTIPVGARASPLSIIQVDEVLNIIKPYRPDLIFQKLFIKTTGDIDTTTPLWDVESDDFFTRELDQLLLDGSVRITIHSAKDLPKILHKGLSLLALTKGVDQRDSLVMRPGDTISTLPHCARIGTSSLRRIQMIPKLRSDFIPFSIRGTIHDRLNLLLEGSVDALIIAQAAIIRLSLTSLNHEILAFPAEPLQGQLAVVGKSDDTDMAKLFHKIDVGKLK